MYLLSIVEEYVRIQTGLVDKLIVTFDCSVADTMLLTWPKRGEIRFDESVWKFYKHGLGHTVAQLVRSVFKLHSVF